MAVGTLLLFMQLHGYMHAAFADNSPISRDDHLHAHDQVNPEKPAHTHNPDGSHLPGMPDHGPGIDNQPDSDEDDSGTIVPEHI